MTRLKSINVYISVVRVRVHVCMRAGIHGRGTEHSRTSWLTIKRELCVHTCLEIHTQVSLWQMRQMRNIAIWCV